MVHAFKISESMIIASVKKHFPLIKAERAKITQTRAKYLSSQGIFDANIDGKVSIVPYGGYKNRYFDGLVTQPIEHTGAKLYAGVRYGRGLWPTYYQNYLTNTRGETLAGLSLPLSRNLAIDEKRAKLINDAINIRLQSANLKLKINETISKALSVYYSWIQGALRVNVAKEQLNIAVKRQRAIDTQVKVGDSGKMAKIENVRFIMQRKSKLAFELQKYQVARQQLSFYLRDKKGLPILAKANQIPKLNRSLWPMRINKKHVSYLYSIQPLLNQVTLEVKKAFTNLKQAINLTKPIFDVDVHVDKQHGQGNFRLSQTSVNFGLKYQIPLRLREARGRIMEQKFRLRELQYYKQYLTQWLMVTIHNLMVDIDGNVKTYRFNSREVSLASALVQAERQRFFAGDSSLFLVNQRELTAANAKLEAINHLIQYYKSRNLLKAQCLYRKKCIRKVFHSPRRMTK